MLNKKYILGGVAGLGVIGGGIALYLHDKKAAAIQEQKDEEFKALKVAYLTDCGFEPKTLMAATLSNNEVKNCEDRAYLYKKITKLFNQVLAASDEESMYANGYILDEFLDAMQRKRDGIDAYLSYLKQLDADEAERKLELEKRRKEELDRAEAREQRQFEESKLRLQLKTEEKKGEHIVDAISAVAGSNKKESDINITVTNDSNNTEKEK